MLHEGPSIFLGYSFGRGNPKPWEYFKIPYLMINAYDIITRIPNKNVHKALSYDGFVCCDSGGWQILQGKKIDILEVIEVQRKLRPDLAVMLDNGLDETKNIENLKLYIKKADFDFIPAFPYYTSKKTLEKISKLCDPIMIGIGGIVPVLRAPINLVEFKNVITSIKNIKEHFPDTKLHVFGVGGLYIAMILFLFVDSLDTSSWLHDAKYGKIRLFGKGVYGTHPMDYNPHINKESYNCKCPICRKHSLEELDERGISSMQLRASHNAWILLKEMEQIRKEMKSGSYLEYINDRVKSRPRHILKFVFDKFGDEIAEVNWRI
ncbi:MAG TPA: hypothetical protein VIO58_03630 [Candidatus Methanoperedens sp.]